MITKRALLEKIDDLEKRLRSFQDDVVFCRNFEIYGPPETYDCGNGEVRTYQPSPDRVPVKEVVSMLLDHLGLEIQPEQRETTSKPAALVRKKKAKESA